MLKSLIRFWALQDTILMGKELFGTDGIRGIPGEYPLDDATLERVGNRAWEVTCGRNPRNPRVLIGRDTRESGLTSPTASREASRQPAPQPVSAGVLTTPGVAWLVNREGFAAGVVISASHNPYHDNGVKLISSSGMKFPDAVEAALESHILSKERPCSGDQACSPERRRKTSRGLSGRPSRRRATRVRTSRE